MDQGIRLLPESDLGQIAEIPAVGDDAVLSRQRAREHRRLCRAGDGRQHGPQRSGEAFVCQPRNVGGVLAQHVVREAHDVDHEERFKHRGYPLSRCTFAGENAGRQTAMYSAPSGSGVPYWTHSPRCVMIACPGRTSSVPSRVATRSMPARTSVYSSNSGVCPGSTQPPGLFMRAMLAASVFVFTRPTNSWMILGLFPAAVTWVGAAMNVGMNYFLWRLSGHERKRLLPRRRQRRL